MLRSTIYRFALVALFAGAVACGDSSTSAVPGEGPSQGDCDGQSYESTFEAVQTMVFDPYCVSCHSGDQAQSFGALDLSAGVSHANLVDVPSVGSPLARIYPGAKELSSLYVKVARTFDLEVRPPLPAMPPGGNPAPREEDLKLLAAWIQGGAPSTGTVPGSLDLLPGCLPPVVPQPIRPLAVPAPEEGFQIRMPGYRLAAASETEVCMAVAYDYCDQIPAEFKTADGTEFYYGGYEVRQDINSHHFIYFRGVMADGSPIRVEDLEGWTCGDGDRDGQPCDPKDPDSCGEEGVCRTPVRESLACSQYAEPGETAFFPTEEIAVQQAQTKHDFYEGTYRTLACAGVALLNSHAFNLTPTDHRMRARMNIYFAQDRRFPQKSAGGFDTAFGIPRLLAEGPEPYSEGVLCERMVLPRGAAVTAISSHTHSHGKHFWYEDPDGTHIYDSYLYDDPLNLYLEEPMVFEDEDPARRTLTYCSLYRNGVDEEGNRDPETVTRASRIQYPIPFFGPGSTLGFCEPKRCVNEGRYEVECDDGIANQAGDDAACDSSPGAGDGWCDACRITGGITTENEMFGAQVWYFIKPGYPRDVRVEFPDSTFFGFGPPGEDD